MSNGQLVGPISQVFGKGCVVFHVDREGHAFKEDVDDRRQHRLRDRGTVADGQGVQAAVVTADTAAEIEIFLKDPFGIGNGIAARFREFKMILAANK